MLSSLHMYTDRNNGYHEFHPDTDYMYITLKVKNLSHLWTMNTYHGLMDHPVGKRVDFLSIPNQMNSQNIRSKSIQKDNQSPMSIVVFIM